MQELLDTIFRLFSAVFLAFIETKLFFFFFPQADNTSAVNKYTSETVVQGTIPQTAAGMEGEEGRAMH